jgi:chromosome segregation ATPase
MNQKLTEFRTWSRNEFRSHRQLETRIQSLEEDLQREHRLQDEMNRLLTISEQTKSEREALLMRNEYVIADLQATVNKFQEYQKSNNDNDEKLQIQLEVEQQHNHKLTLELKMKDSEVLSLSKALENMRNEYSKLQKKNDMINQKLITSSQGGVAKEDDARVVKASLASLTAKFENLQREFEFSERSRYHYYYQYYCFYHLSSLL